MNLWIYSEFVRFFGPSDTKILQYSVLNLDNSKKYSTQSIVIVWHYVSLPKFVNTISEPMGTQQNPPKCELG